jgi:LysR family glycine cleavage system transcriptional activator
MFQPPLLGLRAFVEVGRRGSIKDAAAVLGVTPGAVSQQIRALEQRFGTRLLERFHRGVRMSPEGNRLFAALDPAFGQIEDAIRPFSGRAGRAELLTVSTTPSFAATWLAGRIGRFSHDHGFEVRLQSSVSLVDLRGDSVDLAIRHGSGVYAGLTSERLFRPRLIVVASPERIRLEPAIREPGDCLLHPLLQDRDRRDWSAWFESVGGRPTPRWLDGSILADDSLLIRAAIGGHGLAVVRDVYAHDDLASGRLTCPIEASAPTVDGYFLVIPPDRMGVAKVKAFRKWLLAEAAATRTVLDPATA